MGVVRSGALDDVLIIVPPHLSNDRSTWQRIVCSLSRRSTTCSIIVYVSLPFAFRFFLHGSLSSPAGRPVSQDGLHASGLVDARWRRSAARAGDNSIRLLINFLQLMRMQKDLGVHRSKARVEAPTVDRELHKRVFWVLVYLDRMASSVLGRTCSVRYFE